MKVSVIIPFYSNINWLEEAVDSVLNQTFKDYEIIVINDGSSEDDSMFLKKYKEKIIYFKTVNKGPAHARNYGISVAEGEYLAFLDSDDLWLKDKLEKQVNFMTLNNSDWSHTNYCTFEDKSKKILNYNKLDKFSGYIFPQSLAATHIATPSVIIRREVLLENEFRFQEAMRFGQDYYLWLKLSESYKLDLIPLFLLKVRLRGTNAAIRARAHIQLRAQIWNLLKDNNILNKIKYKKLFRINYKICYLQNLFIKKLEKRCNNKILEIICKIIYFFPYLMFKILFKISK